MSKSSIKELLTPLTSNPKDFYLTSPTIRDKKTHFVHVYNQKITVDPLQKIWIKTPRVKLVYHTLLQLSQQWKSLWCRVVLSPVMDNTKELLSFIKKTERYIRKEIHAKYGKHLRFSSSLSEKEFLHPIWRVSLPVVRSELNASDESVSAYELGFHIYNHDHHKIRMNKIEAGTYVSMYVELSDIWVTSDQFGCNWSVRQMKVYPKLDFSSCLFDDEEIEEIKPEKETSCYHCLHCPNHHVTSYAISPNSHGFMPNHMQMQTPYHSGANVHQPPRQQSPKPIPKTAASSKARPVLRFNPAMLQETRNKLKSVNRSDKNKPTNQEAAPKTRFHISVGDIISAKSRLKSRDESEKDEKKRKNKDKNKEASQKQEVKESEGSMKKKDKKTSQSIPKPTHMTKPRHAPKNHGLNGKMIVEQHRLNMEEEREEQRELRKHHKALMKMISSLSSTKG